MSDIKVKKILRKIYNIDYSKILLRDDDEFILQANGISEFTEYLVKRDMDNGVIVTPSGYKTGLFYSINNDGELYSSSKLLPDIVNFTFNIYGLKKNHFYRITVLARDTDSNTIITDDRSLTVLDDSKQAIINTSLKGYKENQEIVGYFRSFGNEANIHFSLGKIVIKDINIDEVVLQEEDKFNEQEQQEITETISEGTESLCMFGIYSLSPSIPEGYKGRYILAQRLSGRGMDIYYDQIDKVYVLEKSNIENLIDDPFTNIKYKVDLNIFKLPNNDIFDNFKILDVSTDISPNTLKQGYIKFAFIKNNENVLYNNENGRLYISVYQYK